MVNPLEATVELEGDDRLSSWEGVSEPWRPLAAEIAENVAVEFERRFE
jgi:hypothetical protein